MASDDIPEMSEEDPPQGAPAWVVSFADMSLLLLSFFIMLLAVSSQSRATDDDILKVLAAIKVGFGYTPKESSNDQLDLAVLQIMATKKRGPMKSDIERRTAARKGKTIRDAEEWIRVKGAVGDVIIFNPNSSTLQANDDVQSNLTSIASLVRTHYRRIVVQGHCSPGEAARNEDGGHWLAFQRAITVRDALVARQVDPSRIRVVSCASHNTNKESLATIRSRVVVTLGNYFLPGKDS